MASEFIVLSHTEPYREEQTPHGVELRRKTNGVFTTLDSVMRRKHGTWIARRERDEDDGFISRILVPSEDHPEAYAVRRVGLDLDEARRFYYDFTSTAIWPVLFSLLDRARFTAEAVAVPRYPLSLRYGAHDLALRADPVGLDVEYFGEVAQAAATREQREEIRRQTGARTVILATRVPQPPPGRSAADRRRSQCVVDWMPRATSGMMPRSA